jgi:hypothetical protein
MKVNSGALIITVNIRNVLYNFKVELSIRAVKYNCKLQLLFVLLGPMVASVRLDGDLFGRSQSYNQASFEQSNALNMNNVNNHMHRSVKVTSYCKG